MKEKDNEEEKEAEFDIKSSASSATYKPSQNSGEEEEKDHVQTLIEEISTLNPQLQMQSDINTTASGYFNKAKSGIVLPALVSPK